MQFLENKFKVDSETTIGVEFGSKIVDIQDKKVKMQIWDTVPSLLTILRLDKKFSNQSQDHTIVVLSAPS